MPLDKVADSMGCGPTEMSFAGAGPLSGEPMPAIILGSQRGGLELDAGDVELTVEGNRVCLNAEQRRRTGAPVDACARKREQAARAADTAG